MMTADAPPKRNPAGLELDGGTDELGEAFLGGVTLKVQVKRRAAVEVAGKSKDFPGNANDYLQVVDFQSASGCFGVRFGKDLH